MLRRLRNLLILFAVSLLGMSGIAIGLDGASGLRPDELVAKTFSGNELMSCGGSRHTVQIVNAGFSITPASISGSAFSVTAASIGDPGFYAAAEAVFADTARADDLQFPAVWAP